MFTSINLISFVSKIDQQFFYIALDCVGLGITISARFTDSSDLSTHSTKALSEIEKSVVDIGINIHYQIPTDQKYTAITVGAIEVIQEIIRAIEKAIVDTAWI
ncbi:hypothetical protein K502DRAFT_348649 [Neoconidiobolus thromboides FSU 785]|nr:hypothetical protein K502DRAFT_348649 [Neoconidiobolus thromboides FSU 785]